MNETKKTGIFCGVAVVSLLLATIVTWPKGESEEGTREDLINEPLFPEFKDALAAASMKIVTFDEAQGTLSNFEVRKDPETGEWTIPSREGYPADAVEQMKEAANALVDLKILDLVPANVEDHDEMGVIEPALEDLSVGDDGVGRMVTFEDEAQKTLASIIIGDKVKDAEGQLYVRKPGQDPVYAVALDDKPLTTNFQDWIEEDLLKLSSIDVEDLSVKDYSASLNIGSQISLSRNFEADLKKEGSQWTLAELREFDPKRAMADPKVIEPNADDKLNTSKINDIQNALDDLKIVNVLRKPDGMSANLKADKDFLSDQKAVNSLARRGFYPVPIGKDGETEILSANGEMTVGLKDGVEYVLRFGNISGLSTSKDKDGDEDDGDEKSSGGVNRYLLVTTRVNMDKFPPPELKDKPNTLEELEAMEAAEEEKNALPEIPDPDPADKPSTEESDTPKEEMKKDAPKKEEAEEKGEPKDDKAGEKEDDKSKEAAEKKADEKADSKTDSKADTDKKEEAPKKEKEPESKDKEPEQKDAAKEDSSDSSDEGAGKEDAKEESSESGDGEAKGSGSGADTGQALMPQDEDKEAESKQSVNKEADTKEAENTDKKAPEESKEDDESKGEEKASNAEEDSKEDSEPEEEETEEEKQERLEAAQEKITKENQRKVDERKDKLAKAESSVRALNARFADWYYVIPEETYAKLTIQRADLFEKKEDASAGPGPGAGGPSFQGRPPFQIPGVPGN